MSGIPTRDISFSPRWEETGQGKKEEDVSRSSNIVNKLEQKKIVFRLHQ